MANATVGINFVIEQGKDGLWNLTKDADGLRKAMTQTLKVSKKMRNSFSQFSMLSTGLKNKVQTFAQTTRI